MPARALLVERNEPGTTHPGNDALLLAQKSKEPKSRTIDILENGDPVSLTVTRNGLGPILTSSGRLWELNFSVNDRWGEYHALVAGKLDANLNPFFPPDRAILIRIDSGCTTGQLFTDKNCDCAEQLRLAMARIAAAGTGVVISIPAQEGRGMGAGFKLATLLLQERLGLDTYDAAVALAGNNAIDVRTYAGAVAVLRFLGITSESRIGLMTNNPQKLAALAQNGYASVERVPICVDATNHTAKHLAAKREKLGHLD